MANTQEARVLKGLESGHGRALVNPSFSNTKAKLERLGKAASERTYTMRKKYCDQESVFAHIWNHADAGGLWDGDASTVAAEFGVSEDEAHDMLSELCDGHHVEKVVPGKHAIVKWTEPDEEDEPEARR